MLADGDVPESRIKDSIATALRHMRHDKRLDHGRDPGHHAQAVPGSGVFDEADSAKVVDVSSGSRLREGRDAEFQLAPADKLKVLTAMGRAES